MILTLPALAGAEWYDAWNLKKAGPVPTFAASSCSCSQRSKTGAAQSSSAEDYGSSSGETAPSTSANNVLNVGIKIMAPMAADSDGAPANTIGDTGTHQNETSLMLGNGKPLNSNNICFVVLPLKAGWKNHEVLKDVKLGDFAKVTYKGKTLMAIAGDKGPGNRKMFGEGSLACLRAFGLKTNGNIGISEPEVLYEFFPGSGNGGKFTDETDVLAQMQRMSAQDGTAMAPSTQK